MHAHQQRQLMPVIRDVDIDDCNAIVNPPTEPLSAASIMAEAQPTPKQLVDKLRRSRFGEPTDRQTWFDVLDALEKASVGILVVTEFEPPDFVVAVIEYSHEWARLSADRSSVETRGELAKVTVRSGKRTLLVIEKSVLL